VQSAAAILIAILTVLIGLFIRAKTWELTEPIRYRGDMSNALRIGTTVLGEARLDAGQSAFSESPVTWWQFFHGYFSLYNRVAEFTDDGQYSLDYVPMRLLVMSLWAKHVHEAEPHTLGYRDDMAWPLLWFNTCMEFTAATLMFSLVYGWTGSVLRAYAAAVLLWFNPAVLLEAHGWPQWEVWVLPFYLGAMLLALSDRWFTAGLCVGIGCMFKGQMLLVAPVFILWPLFLARLGATGRLFMGFGVVWLGLASPWLLSGWRPWIGVVTAISGSFISSTRPFAGNHRSAWIARTVVTAAIVVPWLASFASGIVAVIVLSCFILVAPLWMRVSARRYWLAFIWIGSILLASWSFGGSWAWFEIGYGYGLRHYPRMANGAVDNLPAVLAPILNWQVQTVLFSLPIPFAADPVQITVKVLLGSVYGISLLLCGLGAAIHHRRRDPQVLVALIAPWILLFAINVQMHGRYLFWGAAFGSVAVASSAGLTAINIVVSILSTGMIAQTMLEQNAEFAPGLLQFLQATCPALGWAVILIACIYLFNSVWPRRLGFSGQMGQMSNTQALLGSHT
jgi:hypothetical protein